MFEVGDRVVVKHYGTPQSIHHVSRVTKTMAMIPCGKGAELRFHRDTGFSFDTYVNHAIVLADKHPEDVAFIKRIQLKTYIQREIQNIHIPISLLEQIVNLIDEWLSKLQNSEPSDQDQQ